MKRILIFLLILFVNGCSNKNPAGSVTTGDQLHFASHTINNEILELITQYYLQLDSEYKFPNAVIQLCITDEPEYYKATATVGHSKEIIVGHNSRPIAIIDFKTFPVFVYSNLSEFFEVDTLMYKDYLNKIPQHIDGAIHNKNWALKIDKRFGKKTIDKFAPYPNVLMVNDTTVKFISPKIDSY